MSDETAAEGFEVTAGPMAPGGRSFARLDDGTPLFLDGAVPGERVRGHVTRRRRRVVEGCVDEVLEAAPERVTPSCPWADRCGGCDWMHVDYAAQLRFKGEIAAEAGRRQARLARDTAVPVVPSPRREAYRSRVRLHVDLEGHVGYFARGTHDVVEIDRCAIAQSDVNAALSAARDAFAGIERTLGEEVSGIELRGGDDETDWAAQLFLRHRGARPSTALRSSLSTLASMGGTVWLNGRPYRGAPRLRYPLPGGQHLWVGPLTFTQGNPRANEQLIQLVVALAAGWGEPDPAAFFVDLYCGAGNFTLPLLARGMRGVGVELSPDAIAGARDAARELGLPVDAFRSGKVGTRSLHHLSDPVPEVVILDPPRTGAREAVSLIVEDLRPARVVYVGCDPVTQARDVGALREAGYEVATWEAIDLFPHTHHVESVMELRRPE